MLQMLLFTDLYNTQRKFADYETLSCPSKNTVSFYQKSIYLYPYQIKTWTSD